MPAGFGYVLTLALLPQLILVGVALICAVIAVVRPNERPDLYRWLACIGFLGAVAACGFVLFGMRLNRNGIALLLWNGGLSVDHFSLFVTVAACVFGLVTCLVSDTYVRRIPSRSGAFFALLLVATTATSALASQHEMISFFVALQVLLVSLVAIGALVKTNRSGAESSWRLLVEGGVASGLVLYGLAILYGVTGSSDLGAVGGALGRAPGLSAIGVALVLLGMTFFTGVFPMRQWLTRASEGMPAAAAGFVITMGVTGGAVAFLRLGASGFGPASRPWAWLTSALIVIALVHAATLALRENGLRRLVAAVVSSQAALLLLAALDSGGGASGAAAQGPTAFLFALVVFGLATLATFAMLAMLQTAGLGDSLRDYRGLAHRSPATAVFLALALATLVGLPPLAGFVARLLIVETGVDAGYGWLAVVALVATALTALPVVRVVASMYAEVGDEVPFTLAATPRLGRMVATFCCLAAVFLTVLAQPLLLLARGGAGPIP